MTGFTSTVFRTNNHIYTFTVYFYLYHNESTQFLLCSNDHGFYSHATSQFCVSKHDKDTFDLFTSLHVVLLDVLNSSGIPRIDGSCIIAEEFGVKGKMRL